MENKLFKVYAQCCVSAKPISEVYNIDEYIDMVFDDAINNGYIDIDEEKEADYDAIVSDAYEKIRNYFDQNGFLECGDFKIVKAADIWEVRRENAGGWSTGFIF